MKNFRRLYFRAMSHAIKQLTSTFSDIMETSREEAKQLHELGLSDSQLCLVLEIQLLHKTLKRIVKEYNDVATSSVPTFKLIKMNSKPTEEPNDEAN